MTDLDLIRRKIFAPSALTYEQGKSLWDALMAERERADQAEQRIAEGKHDSKCQFPVLGWNCTCYKQEREEAR